MVPILSVCLITYNHVKYIEQAIEGVLLQQVDFSFELVIADDCSTDGTRELLLEFKKKYPDLIKLILQEKNVGPAKNWLDLITFPQCKYIAYFEGDDYWTDPYKLQKQVNFLETNEDFAVSCTNAFQLNQSIKTLNAIQNVLIDSSIPSRVINKNEIYFENCILTLTVMFRNVIKVYPQWITDAYLGDWTLNILFAQYGKIQYINDITAVYRIHNEGLFSSKPIILKLYNYLKTGEVIRNNLPAISNEMIEGQRSRFFELIHLSNGLSLDYKLKYFFEFNHLLNPRQKFILLFKIYLKHLVLRVRNIFNL